MKSLLHECNFIRAISWNEKIALMTSRTSTLPPNPDTLNTTTRAPSHARRSPSSHCTLFCRPVAGHLAVAHQPSTIHLPPESMVRGWHPTPKPRHPTAGARTRRAHRPSHRPRRRTHRRRAPRRSSPNLAWYGGEGREGRGLTLNRRGRGVPPPLVAVTSPLSLVAANAPLALLLAGEREIPRGVVRVVRGRRSGMCFGVERGRGCGVMLARVGLLGRRGRAICRWHDGSSNRLCVL